MIDPHELADLIANPPEIAGFTVDAPDTAPAEQSLDRIVRWLHHRVAETING
jgi:hypothetical protein